MLELHEGAEGQGLGGWPLWGRLPACGQPSTALPPGGALGYPSASVAPPPRTRLHVRPGVPLPWPLATGTGQSRGPVLHTFSACGQAESLPLSYAAKLPMGGGAIGSQGPPNAFFASQKHAKGI